jgi:uncharacterized membrane protein
MKQLGSVAVVAAAGAAIGWAAARASGVHLVVRSGSGSTTVGLASAVVVALVVSLVAGALLRALERRTPRGRRIWVWVAAAVLAVSLLAGPLAARTLDAGLVLAGLHVWVAAVVFVGLLRRPAESAGEVVA